MLFPNKYGSSRRTYDACDEDLTMEHWICRRFCCAYDIHSWIHDLLLRALLFDMFSTSLTIPASNDVLWLKDIARQLRARHLHNELWDVIAQNLALTTLVERWVHCYEEDTSPDTRNNLIWDSTEDERSRLAFLSDPFLLYSLEFVDEDWKDQNIRVAFDNTEEFLADPFVLFEGEPDTLRLYHAANHNRQFLCVEYPALSELCSCGSDANCREISLVMSSSTDLRTSYFSAVFNASLYDCDAIERLWDPLLTKAEKWLEPVIQRTECPVDIFPSEEDKRLGPTILDVLSARGMLLEDTALALTSSDALELVTTIRSTHARPYAAILQAQLCETDGFGFVILISDTSIEGQDGDPLIITGGRWLAEYAEIISAPTRSGTSMDVPWSSLHHIYGSDELKITVDIELKFAEERVKNWVAICFPMFPSPQIPTLMPHVHDTAVLPLDEPRQDYDDVIEDSLILVHLSAYHRHVFPLLSVAGQSGFTHPEESVAMKLSTIYEGRFIRTWTRPEVVVGRTCPHRDVYGIQTRCAIASRELLLQVIPANPSLQQQSDLRSEGGAASLHNSDAFLLNLQDDWKRQLQYLTDVGRPLERNRLLIVKCGERDGPANPVVLIAASIGKKVYIINSHECWQCACIAMLQHGYCVGLAMEVQRHTRCDDCDRQREHSARVIADINENSRNM